MVIRNWGVAVETRIREVAMIGRNLMMKIFKSLDISHIGGKAECIQNLSLFMFCGYK